MLRQSKNSKRNERPIDLAFIPTDYKLGELEGDETMDNLAIDFEGVFWYAI